MSDIQSISQGNYILQGTVATSTGIIGDGSTQNPLRADETVLWEGNATDTDIFTESVKNFEYFDVVFKSNDNIIEVQRFRSNMTSTTFNLYSCLFSSSNGLYIKITRMNYSETQFTVNNYAEVNIKNAANPTISISNKITLLKVIGINRING